MSQPASRVAEVVMEVRIAASPQRTWRALTEDVGSWWPAGFYTSERARRMVLEPRLGGLVYEEWGDGEGLVWHVVTAIEHGRRLELAGDLHPEYGGPARLFTRYTLRADGDGCIVRLVDTAFGHCAANLEDRLHEGWGVLLGALKSWTEQPAT